MSAGLKESVSHINFYSPINKAIEYIWQLEDEIYGLKAEIATLKRVSEENRVKLLCSQSENQILKMSGF